MTSSTDPRQLRACLAGVRGLLLDMDGVLVLRGQPIPGAAEALARLRHLGIPYRLVTNASLRSRESLAERLGRQGLPVGPAQVVSALSATAAYTARRFTGRPLYVLAAPDALEEFAGQRLLSHDQSARAGRAAVAGGDPQSGPAKLPEVAAVVVGDAGVDFTHEHLNAAYRLVATGARLIAMHRNPWWLTSEGRTIDSGAFVRALEFASGRRAYLVGKPSTAFFRAALSDLVRDAPGLLPAEVAMVGDDVRADVLAAKRAGMRGVLVLTGRHGPADADRAASGRAGIRPDAIAPSLAEVVAALA